jgi:hypothetical protein
MRRIPALLALAALVSCHKAKETKPPVTKPPLAQRCEVDLSAYTQITGQGAHAHVIAAASDLIGGEAANGQLGDTLLANDQARFIIQQPGRFIGPDPYGGALIDVDRVHSGPGNDKFGKLAPFFNFGRTVDVKAVEVLAPGDQGGAAIVAATGTDAVNNYINIKNQIASLLGAGYQIQLDPDAALGLRITTYYVLPPGKSRLSIVTAFCNDSTNSLVLTAGDLIDSGGDVSLFNPQSGTNGLGYRANPDGMSYLAWMASDDSIAYGVAPWKLNDLSTPELHSNALTVAGVTGYVIGNQAGIAGITEWLTADKRNRSGTLVVPAGKSVVVGREFAVGKDVASVVEQLESARAEKTNSPLGLYEGTVTGPDGPVAGARVVVERPDADGFNATFKEALFVTDAQGRFKGGLPVADYTFTAWQQGRTPSAPASVTVSQGSSSAIALTVDARKALTVTAHDETGKPIPAKVTVRCQGPCPVTPASLVRFEDFPSDSRPDDLQLVDVIPPSGSETFYVPAGSYQVIVTHGPEYSIYPLTAPAQGKVVNLSGTNAAATVDAVLARVVDTSGWLSADFHVHSVNSPDSPVLLVDRAKTFLAEDVNVLLSTDHDFITDYAPINHDLGGDGLMATMIGIEVTTFDYGHFNPWPVRLDASNPVNHGALDWGNGGPGLNLAIDDIFKKIRSDLQAHTIQINHPNGGMSTFGSLKLDADTRKTHLPPASVRLAPSPHATADDTGLFPREKWDAMEVMNGFSRSSYNGLLNNWMTFTATGLVVTATAVSDTHHRWASAGGYPRSYVRMGAGHDSVPTFDSGLMSQAVNGHAVAGTLGLFVKVYAFKSGTTYDLTHLQDSCTAAASACAQVGDTLPNVGSTGLDVVVDVQAPEWIRYNEVNLFDHRAARFMQNGVANTSFAPEHPTAGYFTQSVTLGAAQKEVVKTASGLGCAAGPCTASRWHTQSVFHVDGQSGHPDVPAGDDFYFVVVRDADQTHDLMPMVYDSVKNDQGSYSYVPAHAFAFTNAIFLDRDGTGAYDHFPGLPSTPNPSRAPPAQIRSGSLAWRLHEMLHEIEAE